MTPESPTADREVLPGALHLFGFPKVAAQVTVVRRSPADRMRRALLGLGSFWGIAILCVFIPIAHFVLVPSFLIIGIVVAVRRLREGASVEAVTGVCPRCGVERSFEAGSALRAESTVSCRECHNQLELRVEGTGRG